MLETVSIGRRAISMFLLALVLMSAFTGTAAAQVGSGDEIDATNFICDNEDTQFISIISFLLGLFFVGSFLFGIISYAADKTNDALGSFEIDVLDMDGDDALKAGFGLPIGIWFITFMGNVLFGYDLTCIMPLQ